MEEDDRIAKEEAELQRVHEEWQRKEAKDKLVTGAGQAAVVLLGAAYLALLLWAIRLHRENQLSLPWG
jgi:hypothetical protein